MMELLMVLLCVVAIVGIVLGVYWLIWCLWTWVLPQVWATGPENIINPSFWLFVGCCLIISFVGRLVFGGNSKD